MATKRQRERALAKKLEVASLALQDAARKYTRGRLGLIALSVRAEDYSEAYDAWSAALKEDSDGE